MYQCEGITVVYRCNAEMKTILESVTLFEAVKASQIHLEQAKQHLKLNQMFEVKYELVQTDIHLDMALYIAQHNLESGSGKQ